MRTRVKSGGVPIGAVTHCAPGGRADGDRSKGTPTEHAIQCAIVDWLRYVLPYGWIVQHTANAPRSASAGGKEKARGAVKGWPDIGLYGVRYGKFLHYPTAWFAEVKSAKGRLTPEQVAVRTKLELAGFDYCVVRSIDDMRVALVRWGVDTREVKR